MRLSIARKHVEFATMHTYNVTYKLRDMVDHFNEYTLLDSYIYVEATYT